MSPWLQNLFNDQLELSSFKFNLNEGVGFMKLQGALSKNKANSRISFEHHINNKV
jgi:hypothetical protein